MPDLTRFFHPVMPARALRRDRPARVEIAGRRFAIFRDAQGRPAAVDDACPHRRAPLSRGVVSPEGRLTCAYHGWSFDALGRGRSPVQPGLGRCDVASYQVVERFEHLWLADREAALADFPLQGFAGFSFAGSFQTLFAAPLEVALDNFSEDEHFPTVHSFLGWDQGGRSQVEFSADNFDDRTEVHYRGPQRRHPALPLFGVSAGDLYHNDWVTRFDPVRAIFTFHWRDPRSGAARPITTRTAVFIVPETARTTRFHVFVFVQVAEGSALRWLAPVVSPVALWIGRREVAADARFAALLADAPTTLKGMRLGRYDKPIIHNRKLLQRIYFGAGQGGEEQGEISS